jgi:hypothetical protein
MGHQPHGGNVLWVCHDPDTMSQEIGAGNALLRSPRRAELDRGNGYIPPPLNH